MQRHDDSGKSKPVFRKTFIWSGTSIHFTSFIKTQSLFTNFILLKINLCHLTGRESSRPCLPRLQPMMNWTYLYLKKISKRNLQQESMGLYWVEPWENRVCLQTRKKKN